MTAGETVTDFMPRFYWRDRAFRPQMLVRRIVPISGSPRVRIRVKPRFEYGSIEPNATFGSNHIRYAGPRFAIRLTTDAPIDYILDEVAFNLAEPINLILGPDETLTEGAAETAVTYEERTQLYWKQWVHRLAVPSEWQEAVIAPQAALRSDADALSSALAEIAERWRRIDGIFFSTPMSNPRRMLRLLQGVVLVGPGSGVADELMKLSTSA